MAPDDRIPATMYHAVVRSCIPPEWLLRAVLLQVLFTIRGERMLVEQPDEHRLFRWFVSLSMEDDVRSPSVFSKDQERRRNQAVAARSFPRVKQEAVDFVSGDPSSSRAR